MLCTNVAVPRGFDRCHCVRLAPPAPRRLSAYEMGAFGTRKRFRREKIGFIFQSHQLIHELDVLENVMLPLQLQGWSKTQARNRAAEMLDRVNLLSEYLHYLPNQLSVGQQQRVGIARALIHRPEIIFADEPTASLDDENSEQVMQMILGLQEEYDTTVLMITHDPRDTKNLDRVIRFVESSGRSPWILEMEAPND